MRVLLTGIAGFLGHHLAQHFVERTAWDIIGIASFRHKGDSLRLESLPTSRVALHYHDLAGPISPRLRDRIGPIDVIVNLASESHVNRSIEDPVGVIQNNVNLMLTMLEYAREVRPRTFLQCSTDEVYGATVPGELHPEWDSILPSNPYAASKAAQEAIAVSYWRTYSVPLIITNTMNLYGSMQDPEKFVPMTIGKILSGEIVSIHANGTPGSRCWIHARNYADAVRWLLERPPAMYPVADRPLRYNVVGQRLDNLAMASVIATYLGRKLNYELQDFHSDRPGHDLHYGLDGLALEAAGWKAPVPFEESLYRTIEWSLKHPEWLDLKTPVAA